MAKQTPTFHELIKRFTTVQSESVELARTLSHMALEHFEKHGDVEYIERFYDAMEPNFMRRTAFVKWCSDFSPVDRKSGKFFLNKERVDTNPFNVEKAKEVDWWNHTPEPTLEIFTAAQFLKGLEQYVRRYDERVDNLKAKGKEVSTETYNVLNMGRAMVDDLRKKAEHSNLPPQKQNAEEAARQVA